MAAIFFKGVTCQRALRLAQTRLAHAKDQGVILCLV